VRAIASVRERITSPEAQDLFKRWFDASPFYSGTVVANRLGWQVGRTLAKEVSLRLRQVPAGPALPTTLADALERDGIVVIPNYLSSEDAARVRAAHRHYGSSPHVRDIGQENESRITFRTGRVARDSPGDDGDLLLRLFGADPLMIALAEQVIRRRITPPLPLVYQHLEVPDHVLDSYDREQLLHADKHYPCAKAIYCVDAVTEESSPFIYCVGSHRLTPERLAYERAMSIREAELRAGRRPHLVDEGSDEIDFERSRNVIGREFRRRLGLVERPIVAEANTLVVVNNRGFHRRGSLAPGHSRRTLWVNFYMYQRPWYGRLAFRATKLLVDTDNVSRAPSAIHSQES